jgi:hypothetical protein
MFAFLLLVHMNFSIKEYGDTDPHSCAVFRSPELVPPFIGGQDLRSFLFLARFLLRGAIVGATFLLSSGVSSLILFACFCCFDFDI